MIYTSKITKKPPSFLTPPWAGLFISLVVFFRKGFAILNVLKQDHKNNNQVTGPVLYHQGVYSGDIFLAVVDYSFLVLIEYCSVKRMAWKISCIVHFWLTFEFSPSVAGCWTGGKEEQKGGLENSSPWEGSFDKRWHSLCWWGLWWWIWWWAIGHRKSWF